MIALPSPVTWTISPIIRPLHALLYKSQYEARTGCCRTCTHLLVERGGFQQSRLSRPLRVPPSPRRLPSQPTHSLASNGLTSASQAPSTSTEHRSDRYTYCATSVRIYEESASILPGSPEKNPRANQVDLWGRESSVGSPLLELDTDGDGFWMVAKGHLISLR